MLNTTYFYDLQTRLLNMPYAFYMKNIYLLGFMGSGKSFIGKKLSENLGLNFLDLDLSIEDASQLTITQIFSQIGEKGFRLTEANVLRKTADISQHIISCGGGTPCYHDNMKWIKDHGISIYLKTSTELLFRRLNNQKNERPLICNMQDEELKQFISIKLDERENYYSQADYIHHQTSNDNDFDRIEKYITEELKRSRP